MAVVCVLLLFCHHVVSESNLYLPELLRDVLHHLPRKSSFIVLPSESDLSDSEATQLSGVLTSLQAGVIFTDSGGNFSRLTEEHQSSVILAAHDGNPLIGLVEKYRRNVWLLPGPMNIYGNVLKPELRHDSRVLLYENTNETNLTLTETFSIPGQAQPVENLLWTWSDHEEDRKKKRFHKRRADLRGVTLRVATEFAENVVFLNKTTGKYYGPIIEVVETLAIMLNFSIEFVVTYLLF